MLKYLQEVPSFGVVVSCLLIFLGYLIKNSQKKYKKQIDIHLLNKRILEFRSEQLIDLDKSKALRNKILELPKPDENNTDCLNLAQVNYLNLLNNDETKRKAEECIRSYGVGSCGPRGFYGTIDIHLNLESHIANFMGMEETVLYSYGFSTIPSAIGAYCKKSDIIFCDEHISFYSVQGFIAAKSTVVYFKHNDTHDLESKLKEYEIKEIKRNKLFRKFLIVEGIYKKTGTICPLPQLMELRRQYKLRIFIDESLSFGVLGKTGRGVTEHYNIDRSNVDMIMGSLEGSIGSIGGFCVGASVVIEHQRLSGLGYCFSASLPPFLSCISIYALELFKQNQYMFEQLAHQSIAMDKKLKNLHDFDVISDPLSPLKVIAMKKSDNNNEIKNIWTYCAEKNLYLLITEENKLCLNININMKDWQMDKVVDILNEATKVIKSLQ